MRRLDLLLLMVGMISSIAHAEPAAADADSELPPGVTRFYYLASSEGRGEASEISLDIYNAESDPVLVDFALKLRTSYSTRILFGLRDTLCFKLVTGKDRSIQGVSIIFDTAGIQKRKSERSSEFYAPMRLEIDFRQPSFKFMVLAEEKSFFGFSKSTTEKVYRGSVEREEYVASEWLPIDASKKLFVLEPNNVRPVPLETYFAGRSVKFTAALAAEADGEKAPPRDRPSSGPSFGYSSSYSFSGSSLAKAEDIQLSESEQKYRDKIWELIQKEHKPTMQEFLAAIEFGPGQAARTNPFQNYGGSANHFKDSVVSSVPEMVVALEKAFPGAIWYALGRDIYLLGDAIDAFYISKNSPNRVRRLHASAPSFDGASPELTARFLESNGFNLHDVSNEPARVIFDVTSYSKSESRYSQSSHLMRAAYDAWQRNGGDARELLRKVNFVSVSDGVKLAPGLDLEKYFSEMTFQDGPATILRVEPSYALSYTQGWHSVYGAFETQNDGSVTAPPGSASPKRSRLEMLGEMFAVAQGAFSEEFGRRISDNETRYRARVHLGSCSGLLGKGD